MAALTAPALRHTVAYGISDNRQAWWDNTAARHLGFRPLDSADGHRRRLEAGEPAIDPVAPAARYQGGGFVTKGPFN